MNIAQSIRNFFDTLFPVERRAEIRLITHLEGEVTRLRHERDVLEAECQRMRLAIMPLTSLAGVAVVAAQFPPKQLPNPLNEAPAFPRELSWEEIQAEHEKWMTEEDAKDAAKQQETKNV